MTDVSYPRQTDSTAGFPGVGVVRLAVPVVFVVAAIVACASLVIRFQAYTTDDPLLTDSTLGELALWVADQSAEDAPESLLGQLAKAEAARSGAEALDADVLLTRARDALVYGTILVVMLGGGACSPCIWC